MLLFLGTTFECLNFLNHSISFIYMVLPVKYSGNKMEYFRAPNWHRNNLSRDWKRKIYYFLKD